MSSTCVMLLVQLILNENNITGLRLVSLLETCILEVMNLPISDIAIGTKRLLGNIRANAYSQEEISRMASFLTDANQHQIDNLIQGLYGLYTTQGTDAQTLTNVNLLAPYIWSKSSDDTKRRIGIKLATSTANGDAHQSRQGNAFIRLVNGLSFVPGVMYITELSTALSNLINAHRNLNNFYNEPPFAKQVQRIVGERAEIPLQVEKDYVWTLVDVFLTNGNGECYDADHIYRDLISKFNERQSLIALVSYKSNSIDSKLQFSRSRTKFKELLNIIKPKLTDQAAREFAEELETERVPLDKISADSTINRKLDSLIKIIT